MVGAALVVMATSAIAIVVAGSGAPAGADGERRLVGAVLFTTPAAIGLVGAWRREPALLVAAAILCLVQSVLAFSGLTIVYLPAALTFLRAAGHDAATPRASTTWSPAGIAAAVLVGLALAFLVIRFTGIYGVLAVVVAGGLARLLATPRRDRPELTPASALLGVLVIGLVIAGWVAATGSARDVCWIERQGPKGVVREQLPEGQEPAFELGGDVLASGCDGGIPTREGTMLAMGFAGLAIAAGAVLPSVTRDASGGAGRKSLLGE